MVKEFIVHADDFGSSRAVTDSILDVFDNGLLTSSSIIANGRAFDYAIEEFRRRDNFRLAVHLNLVEGKPLLPLEEVSMLVDRDGLFHFSFLSLWLRYMTCSQKEQKVLRQQVKREIAAQVKKVKNCFNEDFQINIDSHQHLHMVPFVFDMLLDLRGEMNISYIRVADEPFFLCYSPQSLRSCFGPNMIKHCLLNRLAKRQKKILSQLQIRHCNHFIGVLFTGTMPEDSVRSAISSITKLNEKDAIVEILFHPGGAKAGEQTIWSSNKRLLNHYYSPWRTREQEMLKRSSLKKFLNTR